MCRRRDAIAGSSKRLAFCVLALLMDLSQSVLAEKSYPTRPVTTVVDFGVGGSADRMARAISAPFAEAIGQSVHVINRHGAGTLLAANYVLDRPLDGYTIFASTFSPYLTMHVSSLPVL